MSYEPGSRPSLRSRDLLPSFATALLLAGCLAASGTACQPDDTDTDTDTNADTDTSSEDLSFTVSGTIDCPAWEAGDFIVETQTQSAGSGTATGGTSSSFSVDVDKGCSGMGAMAVRSDYTLVHPCQRVSGSAPVDFGSCEEDISGVNVDACILADVHGACDAGAFAVFVDTQSLIELPDARFRYYVFQGSTFAGASQGSFPIVSAVDGEGNETVFDGACLSSDSRDSLTDSGYPGSGGAPLAFADGDHHLVLLVDKSGDGIVADDADDLVYFSSFTMTGGENQLFHVSESDFVQLVSHDITVSNETALAGALVTCHFHLPGTDVMVDTPYSYAYRRLFGKVAFVLDGAGGSPGSPTAAPAVPGPLDITCLADLASDGMDSGVDYAATVAGVTIDGTSTAVTGFTLIP